MGIFGFGKNKQNSNNTSNIQNINVINTEKSEPQVGILNLKKNDILDLTKTSPNLENVRVAAGWDVATDGMNYDLDLCAILLDSNNKLIRSNNSLVYYGNKKSKGIKLDGDNLTGEGDGDDENINVTLSKIPEEVNRIIFNVVIYSATSRRQSFKHVKNAFVRLVDEDQNEKEICRYDLTEDGADNTAIEFAELYRNGSGWAFKAIGNFKKASISDLKKQYK